MPRLPKGRGDETNGYTGIPWDTQPTIYIYTYDHIWIFILMVNMSGQNVAK